jgi:deoxycytidylate deaminase
MNTSRRQKLIAICYDKRGRVLSVGENSYVKTHPLQARIAKEVGQEKKIYLHAEVAAIVKLPDGVIPYRMTVVRVSNQGELLNAKPCDICEKLIRLTGIKHVEWSINESL